MNELNTLMAIRAGLRAIIFFSGLAFFMMGAGITDLAPDANLGDAVMLMCGVGFIFFTTIYLHGVINAMYHAERQRDFYRHS